MADGGETQAAGTGMVSCTPGPGQRAATVPVSPPFALAIALLRELEGRVRRRETLRQVVGLCVAQETGARLTAGELRHALGLLGLRPTGEELREAVAARFGARGWRSWGGLMLRVRSAELGRLLAPAWDAQVDDPEPTPTPTEWKTALGSARSHLMRGSRLAQLVEELHCRRDGSAEYYRLAEEYLYSADWAAWPPVHLHAWRLHALRGLTAKETATELGLLLGQAKVILAQHRARAGILRE